ncbi:Gfo/Idh/MocA family oxidoreductase [Lachnospiraceae bacterium 42-17]
MNELKVCFVGTGSIGSRHIRNLSAICKTKNIKLQIDILRSTSRPLQRDVALIVSNIYTTLTDINCCYDLIFITNPTHLHYETIQMLKNHASYFFVEKPVFNTINKSIKSLELPADNEYYVACPLRYTNILQKAKSFVQSNSPISVRVVSSSYLPDWRPDIDYRNTYSAHRHQGGGVSIDLIHEWDYLIWLFGLPVNVKSFCGKFSDLEIDSDDLAVYIAQYKNFLVEVHLDYFGRIPERKLEIYTSEGLYVFDIINNNVLKNGIVIYEMSEISNDKYMKEMEYFLSVYEKKAVNSNNLSMAIQTLEFAACETVRE